MTQYVISLPAEVLAKAARLRLAEHIVNTEEDPKAMAILQRNWADGH